MTRALRNAGRLGWAFTAALALLIAAPAPAQLTTGIVRGQVEGAPAGVRVEALDPSTHHLRTARTRSDGSYFFAGLRPRVYLISAQTPGGRFEEVVRVQVAQTLRVDLHRPLNRGLDEILAEGVAPGYELRSSEVGTQVTSEQIDLLPWGTRRVERLFELAPGVRSR